MFSAINSLTSQIKLNRKRILYLFGFCILTTLFFTIRAKYFERSDFLKPVTRTIKKHSHVKGKDSLSRSKVQNGGINQNSNEIEKVSVWDLWMEDHQQFLSIGDIWNKCDNKTRTKIGKIVLEQNNKDRGVKMIMLMNMTFDHEVTGGAVDFVVHYNGMVLHDKEYDFCEECADLEEPLECPFHKGRQIKMNTVVKLPSYIPKGHYIIFSKIKDQNGKEIGCINAEMLTGK